MRTLNIHRSKTGDVYTSRFLVAKKQSVTTKGLYDFSFILYNEVIKTIGVYIYVNF